jgi:hypothetical protein
MLYNPLCFILILSMRDYMSVEIFKTLALTATISLVGCGGSGGSSSSNDVEKLSNTTNVAGNYTLITSAISAECTDGSSDTLKAIALSGDVSHTGNKIEFNNDNGGSGVGITVIEADTPSGIIEADGKFIMTSAVLAKQEGIDGNLTLSYNLSGYFNDTGWSGEYQYSVFFHAFSESCTYTTPFSGTKS